MFVSQPEYEFPFPPDLAHPGCQHWRVVELTLHAPWFLVSVEIVDPELPDCTVTRTLCIAWDSDLAELLSTLEPDRVGEHHAVAGGGPAAPHLPDLA